MKLSAKGLALMREFESCRLRSYPDPLTGSDPWTIGWGSTGADIRPDLVWTQKQCDERQAVQVSEFEGIINRVVKVLLTQGQFDAMVSIVSNVGPGSSRRDGIVRLKSGVPSTLLRKLNQRDYVGASAQFALWISPGSSVEKGLRRRRAAEMALFNS